MRGWDEIVFTGIQIYYYFIDPKRLWYFSKGIVMEQNSDLVEIGKVISQETFNRNKKEIQIGRIKIDFYRKGLEIHEIKRSSRFKDASRWQLLYYLYVLKQLGVNCRGILHFCKERRIEKLELTPDLEKDLEDILIRIEKIVKLPLPPKSEQSQRIKKSSYFELFMA